MCGFGCLPFSYTLATSAAAVPFVGDKEKCAPETGCLACDPIAFEEHPRLDEFEAMARKVHIVHARSSFVISPSDSVIAAFY